VVTRACHLPEVTEFGAGVEAAAAPRAVQDALQQVLADVDAAGAMAANARRMVAQRFALAAVVDRLVALYGDLRRASRAERP
jgi:glycosyltransferase involved in cell wall biosynthesis